MASISDREKDLPSVNISRLLKVEEKATPGEMRICKTCLFYRLFNIPDSECVPESLGYSPTVQIRYSRMRTHVPPFLTEESCSHIQTYEGNGSVKDEVREFLGEE